MSGPIYAHRASKDVTRRLFIDILHHLRGVAEPSRYQYVGFGALEFVDFEMVHKAIGVRDMFSIEKDANIERYEANKPYRSISLLSGHSSQALTLIDWSRLSIVWLDYECQLNAGVFADIEYLATKLVPGSVLAVTLNAHPGGLIGRRDRFAANVLERRVSVDADDDTLGEWGWAEAQQRLVYATLRNRLQRRPDSASWRQLINVHYKDTAPMQLIAGVVSTPGMESVLDNCHFEASLGYRGGPSAMLVEVPYLTRHEQTIVRKKLPRAKGQRVPALRGVSERDVRNYEQYYQWIDM